VEYGVVDNLLVLCKLAIDWPAAGNITAGTIVLGAKIKQNHVSVSAHQKVKSFQEYQYLGTYIY